VPAGRARDGKRVVREDAAHDALSLAEDVSEITPSPRSDLAVAHRQAAHRAGIARLRSALTRRYRHSR
jgi:hypothetical protein